MLITASIRFVGKTLSCITKSIKHRQKIRCLGFFALVWICFIWPEKHPYLPPPRWFPPSTHPAGALDLVSLVPAGSPWIHVFSVPAPSAPVLTASAPPTHPGLCWSSVWCQGRPDETVPSTAYMAPPPWTLLSTQHWGHPQDSLPWTFSPVCLDLDHFLFCPAFWPRNLAGLSYSIPILKCVYLCSDLDLSYTAVLGFSSWDLFLYLFWSPSFFCLDWNKGNFARIFCLLVGHIWVLNIILTLNASVIPDWCLDTVAIKMTWKRKHSYCFLQYVHLHSACKYIESM